MSDGGGPVSFDLEEIAALIEDLMRIADDLAAGGDEVNAFLVDTVVTDCSIVPSVAIGDREASLGSRVCLHVRSPTEVIAVRPRCVGGVLYPTSCAAGSAGRDSL